MLTNAQKHELIIEFQNRREHEYSTYEDFKKE